MVAAGTLAVWMYGSHVATIDQERGRLRLSYTQDALERYAPGVPLLSLSLTLMPQRYTHGVVRPFLDGLLPEGEARQAVANDVDVLREDTFGLIRALGRDCAGALVIQPSGEPPPALPTTQTAESLADEQITDLVVNLRSAPLGVGGRVRISLAGVQEKLLLTRMSDGSWGRPVNGTPSTHILKPGIATYPNTIENEAFCMRLARHLGLDVADVETTTINGRKLLVVRRYDRSVLEDGSVVRIHQEDFCQATGLAPEKKYEEDGGPSLRRMAQLLETAAAPDSLEALLRAVTLNVLIGNGDAHGKNYSLLHDPSGLIRLSPLYDLLSTLFYQDDHLAMCVDSVHRTDRVTGDRIVSEAAAWGVSRRRASNIVADILDRVPAALDAARDETDDLPPGIPALVDAQLTQIRSAFGTSS